MARVLIPLPDRDFDVTEVAVPWRLLTRAGHRVEFCTEKGDAAPAADPLLLDGVLFGQLGAQPEPCAFYRELEADAAFRAPHAWDATDFERLRRACCCPAATRRGCANTSDRACSSSVSPRSGGPGGPSARSATAYSCSPAASTRRPARASCTDRRTTCLAKYQERTAYWLTSWKLGRYYRTYPAYVEDEVRAALGDPRNFERGPLSLTHRDSASDSAPAFVVSDRNYVSARWPGDAYSFSRRFESLLVAAPNSAESKEFRARETGKESVGER